MYHTFDFFGHKTILSALFTIFVSFKMHFISYFRKLHCIFHISFISFFSMTIKSWLYSSCKYQLCRWILLNLYMGGRLLYIPFIILLVLHHYLIFFQLFLMLFWTYPWISTYPIDFSSLIHTTKITFYYQKTNMPGPLYHANQYYRNFIVVLAVGLFHLDILHNCLPGLGNKHHSLVQHNHYYVT